MTEWPHAGTKQPRREHVDGKKYCPDCKEWLPATTEFFYRNRANWDGFKNICKIDANYRRDVWRRNNWNKVLESSRESIRRRRFRQSRCKCPCTCGAYPLRQSLN